MAMIRAITVTDLYALEAGTVPRSLCLHSTPLQGTIRLEIGNKKHQLSFQIYQGTCS